MSLIAKLKRAGPSGHGYDSTAEEVTAGVDLSGQTLLLTGASSGLGLETLRVLGRRGARVIATARTRDGAERACRQVTGDHLPLACDLANPDSVRACATAIEADGATLDAIIANAGVMAVPRLELARGYELQFFSNHIGHFLLITRLLSSLSPTARVVMVSSAAHRSAPRAGIDFDNLSGQLGYHARTAYGRSKLANLLFARRLARRLPEGQTANAVHPGVIWTPLMRHLPLVQRAALRLASPLLLKTVQQGAATQVYVATRPNLLTTGAYFTDCNVATPSAAASDDTLGERLWQLSEQIVAEL